MDKKKKGIIAEFREFISRGNVVDMAVGIIMGTAFTAIVNSLVKDVFMPVIGFLISGINFGDLKIVMRAASGDRPEAAITYGAFIQNIISFMCVAFVAFWLVKIINMVRRKQEEAPEPEAVPPATPEDIELLREIRDLLKNNISEDKEHV